MSSNMGLFPLLARPQLLPISKTCVYKTVQNGKSTISIPVDIYLPYTRSKDACPIIVYIHGGGWIGGNKTDYSRPLFHEFLSLGFIVTSMDYRLLPETSFSGQQDDIRDIEPWVKRQLQVEIRDSGLKCDPDKIIVAGGSAGAHLALLTPNLWHTSPTAILSLYGPTNFHTLPWLDRGRLSCSRMHCPPCTPTLLADGTDYLNPPTEIALAVTEKDYQRPRQFISLNFFREALVSEFLLRGLIKNPSGELCFPERGCVTSEEIDEISPLQLAQKIRYPPLYQAMGTADEIFEVSHIYDFHSTLKSQAIPCEMVIIEGAIHAFDVREHIGGEVHETIIKPAVNWVAQFAGKSGGG